MSVLPQTEVTDQPSLPALRALLKHPGFWLVALVGLTALAGVDACRRPSSQATGAMYVRLVRVYQAVGRPYLEGRVRCRFQPSCSEYSIQAVEQYGIARGLMLTCSRLWRCRSDVSFGTVDPVPESDD